MNKTFDRAAIMRRAHEIARLQRRADAQRAYDRDVSRLGNRVVHNRTLEAHLAEAHADFAEAMKQAWREAKEARAAPAQRSPDRALILVSAGVPAPRRHGVARAIRMMAQAVRAVPRVLRFLERHFIPQDRRAA
jgi:hypothetical protein